MKVVSPPVYLATPFPGPRPYTVPRDIEPLFSIECFRGQSGCKLSVLDLLEDARRLSGVSVIMINTVDSTLNLFALWSVIEFAREQKLRAVRSVLRPRFVRFWHSSRPRRIPAHDDGYTGTCLLG